MDSETLLSVPSYLYACQGKFGKIEDTGNRTFENNASLEKKWIEQKGSSYLFLIIHSKLTDIYLNRDEYHCI